ncbi:hypothetical protein SCUCBS95973_003079 [Sporothrix curviconia]|uniref:Apple domain-containing protein n=1 Tax=Sporothrix curviconia TaxID=1260050 RepID=A0ABP0BC86_9PEZI
MKSRRNTSESESEPSGNKLRALRATQDSGLSGVSVEMNAWTRRDGSSSNGNSNNNNNNYTADVFPQPGSPEPPAYEQRPPGGYSSAPQSPRHFGQPLPQQQRASSSSSQHQDGRGSRRGSRGNGTPRPAPIPAVSVDGEELYFPLSPAPTKHNRKSDAGTRLTHGSESEVLPPDDRNYPVPPFNPALFQVPPQQEPLPQLQPYRGQGQNHDDPSQPSSTHLRIIHTSAAGPPSIYWSDDGASAGGGGGGGAETATIATSANPSAFTFYRETTPPPGERRRIGDDDNDDDDDNNTIEDEKRTRRPSQFREIGLNIGSPKRGSKRKGSISAFRDLTGGRSGAAAAGGAVGSGSGGGGGGRGNGRQAGSAGDDGQGAGGVHLEDEDIAEQEFFVNGRYVPPALREGRKPGRKPVSEDQDTRSVDSYYNGDRGGRRFWMIAGGVMFFVIAVAVGVGVGVGLTLSKKNSHTTKYTPVANNSTASASTATPTTSLASPVAAALSTTAATTATSTSSTSSSSSLSATATSLTDCPAANGTTYTVPGSSTKFLRFCGIDYSGTGAAVDLSHLPTTSMDDCMNNCAGTSGCTACGWGPPNSSTTSTDSTGFVVSGKNYQCYLKSTLGSAKTATSAESDWCFAIRQ